MTIVKILAVVSALVFMPLGLWADQAEVQVKPPQLHSPRPLEKQTATSVVRDYLQSWQTLKSAFEQNRAGMLDADFVGVAREKLGDTIHQQAAAGIHTHYQDRSHDVQIVFYSPDGLSIQLVDNVDYDEQILSGGKVLATQPVRARYVVVLTPAADRWRVRIFQATPE